MNNISPIAQNIIDKQITNVVGLFAKKRKPFKSTEKRELFFNDFGCAVFVSVFIASQYSHPFFLILASVCELCTFGIPLVSRFISYKKTICGCVGIFLLNIAITVPNFYFWEFNHRTLSCMVINSTIPYYRTYSLATNVPLMAIPIIILVLNVVTTISIRRTEKEYKTLSGREYNFPVSTKVNLTISVVYIVTYIPCSILYILVNFVISFDAEHFLIINSVKVLFDSILGTSYFALNLFLLLQSSPSFRQDFRLFFSRINSKFRLLSSFFVGSIKGTSQSEDKKS
ncbi:uncharacterized protein LOC115230035 [Octopus sinensis]|uniref:Uncharacterized protein LOC115230035 n=1 Tax=Octopus sinensis TaxID=2607531 RepID=A0A6P7TUY5_9MOLL|nr:uncharacterized protein LOC115230035 [Octopus sinensis]